MGLRRRPYAFTEHGAIMAATILNSPRAALRNAARLRAPTALAQPVAHMRPLGAISCLAAAAAIVVPSAKEDGVARGAVRHSSSAARCWSGSLTDYE